jgi:dTDP-glucose 4,6-dehydratase
VNILVTGGAGFIGSNLCRFLLTKYPEDRVVVLDALTYAGNLGTIEDLEHEERFKFHQGRIESPDAVRKVLRSDQIDAIINCAAETHNDRSLLGASDFIASNVLGVDVLLVAAKECGVKRIVHVSTDEVYGAIRSGEFTEESPLAPNTPYSASKAGGDMICRSHFVSYETPVIVTRGGNTYGAFQYPEKLIPFFLSRLVDDKKVPLYGEGDEVREWIHVMDHASGIDTALRKGEPGRVYNISDRNEKKNREVVSLLLAELGKPENLVRKIRDPRQGAHDARYSMSSERLRDLGWKPEVPFELGLKETISWYRQHQAWWRPITAKTEYQAFIRRFYGPSLGDEL